MFGDFATNPQTFVLHSYANQSWPANNCPAIYDFLNFLFLNVDIILILVTLEHASDTFQMP